MATMASNKSKNKSAKPKDALAPDTLSAEELAANYKMAYQVFQADPELWALLQRATAEQWTEAQFNSQLMGTEWWNNNNEYARDAFARRAIGGADWDVTVQEARNLVQQRASAVGVTLDEQQLAAIADKTIVSGWDRAGRQSFLDQELAGLISADQQGLLKGAAGTLQDKLQRIAAANGLQFSQGYFESAARSVAEGLTTEEDWIRQTRDQAASLWPIYSEKIRAGMDAYDLASGYIYTMADELEIDPYSISLNDSYIRSALTGVDDQGNPRPKSLWEFQQELRNDPRWMNTNKAQNQVSSITSRVMEMFGLVG